VQNAKSPVPTGDPNSILRSLNLSLVTLVTQLFRDTRMWFNCLQETKRYWDRASRSADWTSRISFWEKGVNVHLLLGLAAVLKQIKPSKNPQTLCVWFWRHTNNLCLLGRRRYTSCWNLFVMQWHNMDVQSSALFTWCTNSLTFNNCTLCTHCIYVFCIDLRTNIDLCHLQHKLLGFYNRDEKCLQRGTDWGFK